MLPLEAERLEKAATRRVPETYRIGRHLEVTQGDAAVIDSR